MRGSRERWIAGMLVISGCALAGLYLHFHPPAPPECIPTEWHAFSVEYDGQPTGLSCVTTDCDPQCKDDLHTVTFNNDVVCPAAGAKLRLRVSLKHFAVTGQSLQPPVTPPAGWKLDDEG